MELGIGDTLRAARRQQRLTLSDAAAETRVRETYLAALEEEEFAALGGDVYVKGFLRSYAKYLGIDPDPLVEAFRQEYERVDELAPPLSPSAQPALPGPSAGPSKGALITAGAVLGVVALFLIGRGGGPDDTELTSPAPATPSEEQEQAVPDPEGEVQPTSEPTEPSASPSASATPLTELDLAISVEGGPSWMRVTLDEETVLEGPQEEGEELEYSADESFVVRVGDASNVRIEVNGEDQGELGDPEQVVEVTCEVGGSCETDTIEL